MREAFSILFLNRFILILKNLLLLEMSGSIESRPRTRSSIKRIEKNQELEKASEDRNLSKPNGKLESKRKSYSLMEANTKK